MVSWYDVLCNFQKSQGMKDKILSSAPNYLLVGIKFSLAKLLNSKSCFFCLCPYLGLKLLHTVPVPFVPVQHFVWFISEVSKDWILIWKGELLSVLAMFRSPNVWLACWESTCSFGRSNTDLNFVTGRPLSVHLQVSSELKNNKKRCIAAISRWEGRHSNGQPKQELQWFSLTEVYSGWAWGSCQELVGCMKFQA